jgi:capsular exopolysaccharide synthesis family protein
MSIAPAEPRGDGSRERSPLLHAIHVIRERWWLVALGLVAGVVVAALLASSATKQYTATAELLVSPSNLPALVNGTQQTAQDTASLQLQQSNDVSLATSDPVAQRARAALGFSESAGDLADQVSASAQSSNDLIDVSAVDTDPARAAKIANGFANALVAFLNASASANLVAGQTHIESELNGLPATSSERSVLASALRSVIALEAVSSGGLQLVQPASVPGSPSSASVKREAVLGGLAGLIIGLALAFLLDVLDRRVKSTDEIERLYGLPVLATIPAQRRKLTASRVQHDELSVFQILRGGLGFISLRRDVRVVLVTSGVPGEGKTHVATGLALALAAAKKRVILVEADVHRPAAGAFLGSRSGGRGLMNALVDSTELDSLIQPVPERPLLSVLPSGPHTPNSAELLRLPAAVDVLSDLAVDYDFVILDGPPLLPVADAQVLLDNPMIDGVIVVARPNLTTREQIRRVLAILQRHPAAGVGLVLNGATEGRHMYYYPASENGSSTERSRFSRLIGSR